MLKVEKKIFEKVVDQIITSIDIRELVREFSLYRVFYYSLISDISQGRESRHYYILRRIARERKISEQFIIDQARLLLAHLGPDKPQENYYEVLNVSPTASAEDIRKSWINLMKTYHPDTMGEEGLDATKKLNEAYQLLKDPAKRREYNARLLPVAALPIVVANPWTFVRINRAKNVASTKYLLPATFMIAVSGLVFYLLGPGLLQAPVERIRGLMSQPHSKLASKVGSSGLLKPDAIPTTKKPSSSESEKKENNQVFSINDESPIIKAKKGTEELIKEETIEEKMAAKVPKEEVLEKKELPLKVKEKPLQQKEVSGKTLERQKYLVKRGDTLLHVAKRFKTSVKDLRAANDLKADELRYGEHLIIPVPRYEDAKSIPMQVARQDALLSSDKEDIKSTGKEKEKKETITTEAAGAFHQSRATKEIIKPETRTKEPLTVEEPSSLRSYGKEYEGSSYPDRTSLDNFILNYVSAYKSRDINRFISLFGPGAKENGVEISQALSSYRDNFFSLRIVEYDVRVKRIDFNDHWAFVDGDFFVTFRSVNERTLKNSIGNISWLLSRLDNQWKIREINYRIKDTR
jgi:curved DNA-binding protein CbpA